MRQYNINSLYWFQTLNPMETMSHAIFLHMGGGGSPSMRQVGLMERVSSKTILPCKSLYFWHFALQKFLVKNCLAKGSISMEIESFMLQKALFVSLKDNDFLKILCFQPFKMHFFFKSALKMGLIPNQIIYRLYWTSVISYRFSNLYPIFANISMMKCCENLVPSHEYECFFQFS